MSERVGTGISGFDDLVEGGLPTGSTMLVSGGPGTGKTTFCSQFLMGGLENKETCLYVTTGESPDEIRRDAEEFGWNFSDYEDEESFKIAYIKPSERAKHLRDDVEELMDKLEPERVVVDSVSMLGAYWDDEKDIRTHLTHLIKRFREDDATVLLTAEIPDEDSGQFSRYGVAEFLVDGLVLLQYLGIGEGSYRSLQVRKMRRTDQVKDTTSYVIDDNGITVEE